MKILRRIHYNSPVILTFALLSLAVLFCGKLTGGYSTSKLFSVYRSPLTDMLTYPRFFLSQITHIIGGMCGAAIGYALSGEKTCPKR